MLFLDEIRSLQSAEPTLSILSSTGRRGRRRRNFPVRLWFGLPAGPRETHQEEICQQDRKRCLLDPLLRVRFGGIAGGAGCKRAGVPAGAVADVRFAKATGRRLWRILSANGPPRSEIPAGKAPQALSRPGRRHHQHDQSAGAEKHTGPGRNARPSRPVRGVARRIESVATKTGKRQHAAVDQGDLLFDTEGTVHRARIAIAERETGRRRRRRTPDEQACFQGTQETRAISVSVGSGHRGHPAGKATRSRIFGEFFGPGHHLRLSGQSAH
mmetsp:Transcript_22439/g.52968  ORF Transcript_22439/g.52968 Transcript_22439/m.52968 type:complete len:270 (+) Transcript_22439:179-988(+)